MSQLLIQAHAVEPGESGTLVSVSPHEAGWEHIGFRAMRLQPGDRFGGHNQGIECAIVVLSGTCDVDSNLGQWQGLGGRPSVFEGKPHALYLPVGARYDVTATSECEFAVCEAQASAVHPPRLVTPDDVEVEIRGDGNAKRQINKILRPEFPADRLLVVEVFTPSGNWSSYPPHKHDVHAMPHEADLEEVYYYKLDRPGGYAIQKVYTDDRRLDETLTVRDNEIVLIPEGYHPVVAPPGYNVYYLNVLAGSARSMAASDDPAHAWVRDTWQPHAPEPMFG